MDTPTNRAALLQTLLNTLVPDQRVRDEAERNIGVAEKQPGYGLVLAKFALDSQLDLSIRQLSAVLLKRYVRFHWDATAGGAEEEGDGEGETLRTRRRFEPPEVAPEEKAALRACLPPGLCDASSKMRTAIAGVVGEMAASDWPEQWPGLLESLVAGLALPAAPGPADVARVDGCVRCAAQLAEHFDSEQLPAILQHALDPLFAVAAAASLPDGTRARALAVVRACVEILPCVDAPGPLLAPVLARLAPAAAALAGLPLLPPPGAPRPPYATVLELLKVVARVLQEFPKEAAPHAGGLVGAACGALAAALPAFEARLARSPEEDEDEAADPDDPGPDGAVCGLLEVLHVAVEAPRTARAMKGEAAGLAGLALAFAQPPPAQAAAWRDDPARYLAEEEDEALEATPRAAALALAAELAEAYGTAGLRALAAAAGALLEKGARVHGASGGAGAWWAPREAALAALGLLAAPLAAAAKRAPGRRKAAPGPPLDVAAFLAETLRLDAAAPEPLLRARALFTAARLAAGLSAAAAAAVAGAAAGALAEAAGHPVVRLQAIRSLALLAEKLDEAAAGATLPGALGAVAAMLPGAHEELLPLLLDATAALLQRAGDAHGGAQHGAAIAGALAGHLWGPAAARGRAPLLMADVEGTLRAMARAPGTLGALREALLPGALEVLARWGEAPEGAPEAALDVLEVLLARGPASGAFPAHLLPAALPALARLALAAPDRALVQGAAACLAALARSAPAELAAWRDPATGEAGLALVARCAGALLAGGPDDGPAAFAAPLVQRLALHAGAHLGAALPPLLRAAADRLASASDHSLQQALAVALGRVAAEEPAAVLEVLAGGAGLAGPMAAWLEAHGFMLPRSYAFRCSALGLARLLGTRDPRLAAALVPADASAAGPEPATGRLTRSKARAAAGARPPVPLALRMLSALARALKAAPAGEPDEEEEAESSGSGEGPSTDSGDDDAAAPAPGAGRSPFAEAGRYGALLSDVLEGDEGSEDGDAGGAAEAEDPIGGLDLRGALAAVARGLAGDASFVAAAGALPADERAALHAALA